MAAPALQRRLRIGNWNFADDGGSGSSTIYTVTGDVLVALFAVCRTSLQGAGDISLGVSGYPNVFIPSTNATDIMAGNVWKSYGEGESIPKIDLDRAYQFIVTGGQDIVLSLSNVTAGALDFYAIHSNLSSLADIQAT